MGNLFINNNGELDDTTSYDLSYEATQELDYATNLLQALRTYIYNNVSEVSIDKRFGMPYDNVVNYNVPIEPYLQEIITEYSIYFKNITYSTVKLNENLIISINIETWFNNTLQYEV